MAKFRLPYVKFSYALVFSFMLVAVYPTTTYAVKASLDDNNEVFVDGKIIVDPFADIDMQKVLASYGDKGSALMFDKKSIDLIWPSSLALINQAKAIDGGSLIKGEDEFGFTVRLSGDYLFEFDKFDLTENAKTSLQKVYDLYQEYEGKSIVIVGHTDSKGSEEYNNTLSENRANSVAQWFFNNNMIEETISTQGKGESEPIAENEKNGKDHPRGRALNRRVEIFIETNKKVNHLQYN